MNRKLAFRNAARNIKDYGIYFITLVFGVCVFYMFNAIYAQQAMMDLSKRMAESFQTMQEVLSYVSVFVAVVLGFLIVYANHYFMKRRKKEMGIYLTLGMEKKDISKILIMETSAVAVIALVVGLVAGVFLSQFTSIFTARIFEADMTGFCFVFSFAALFKSVICFCLIFLVVILFNLMAVSKCKLIELLYGDRKNQDLKPMKKGYVLGVFLVSVALLITAYILIITKGLQEMGVLFFISIVCGGFGTLLFFYSLAEILTIVLKKKKGIYYKNLNMFVIRQLGSKIKTNFVSVSVVSIVLLFTIGIFATGYGLQDAVSRDSKGYKGYDFTFYAYFDEGDKEGFAELEKWLNAREEIKSICKLPTYPSEIRYGDLGVELKQGMALWSEFELSCIALSDYNACMEMQGNDRMNLGKNEYALISNEPVFRELAERMMESGTVLQIQGEKLQPKVLLQNCVSNGFDSVYIVLADSYVQDLQKKEICLNVNCLDKAAAASLQNAYDVLLQQDTDTWRGYYVSREELLSETIGSKAIFSFLSIYLGVVFMITSAAILAIQQLTEAEDNKERYGLLRKLGVEKKELNRALFIQILCYFLFPLVLAVIHSYFGLIAVVQKLKTVGNIDITKSGGVTVMFVLILYTVYFFVTYAGSKQIIEKR